MIICPHCNSQLTHSDFFIVRSKEGTEAKCGKCRGAFHLEQGPEGTTAKKFDPIVIWVNNTDDTQISFPGRADEPVQDGYHAVEINNLRDADRWTRAINRTETEKAQVYRELNKQYWDEVTKERRADIRAKIGSNPRAMALFKAVQKFVDQKREAKYNKPLDPRGHFHVVAFDSSNRQGYAGPDTGWKEKRS